MASAEPSTKGYITGHDPKPDQAVEVLGRDKFGGYLLPFLCFLRDGAWIKAETGTALSVEVLGWRVSKKFGFVPKPSPTPV
jgi:hypothetical protein